MQETTKPPPQSPYASPLPEGGRDFRAGMPKNAVPPAPTADELAAFVEKTKDADAATSSAPTTVRVVDEKTGDIVEQGKDADVALTEATLTKVAAFLDPTSLGPITLLPARHKLFACRIPTQQEILDVTAITGATVGEQLNAAQAQWSIIGELRKAVYGFVNVESPEAQVLRANIAWPKKWPALREPHWTDSRDPYIIGEEILPLWEQYMAWRTEVVPTKAEIDFYWANQR